MNDWSKQKLVFPRTYSRKPGCYRPWNAASFTPMPIIGTRKDSKQRFGHLQTPQNTPTSSDSEDSSQDDDNTQVISLSEQQSQTDTNDNCSSTDNNEVTSLNPNAPYHYGEKRQYSIIIEESDDMGETANKETNGNMGKTGNMRESAGQRDTPDSCSSSDTNKVTALKPSAPYHFKQKHQYSVIIEESEDMGKTTSNRPPREPPAKCPLKSNRFGRRLPQTKLMKDSLKRHTQSDHSEEEFSSDLDSISFSPNSERDPVESSVTNEELSNIDEPTAEYAVSSESDQSRTVIDDDDHLPDIEVMRDAPPLKTHHKSSGRRGDLASSLKISAMKLHPPGGRVQSKLPYKRKVRNRDRKNSTFREDRLSVKPIQDFSFSHDISAIPGGQTSTSDAFTNDDTVSTIKPTFQQMSSDEGTLKEISLNFEKDPIPVSGRGTRSPTPGYIRTPKKHNIHRDPLRRTPLQLESDGKQVSFSKTNQESLYVPGSRIADTSPQLPQLGSPSMSILKNAVATWNLESPKDKKENRHGATTSTPLWRRRSRCKKPNMMDLSFEVSAVPLPSYDDLKLTALPIKKPVQEKSSSKYAMSTKPVTCSDDNNQTVKSQQKESEYAISADTVPLLSDENNLAVEAQQEAGPEIAAGRSSKKYAMSVGPVKSQQKGTGPGKPAGNTSRKGMISGGPGLFDDSGGLIITSLSANRKPTSIYDTSTSKVSCESPRVGINATPSKQLKRESPGSDVPVRPTKRRAMRIASSIDSDAKNKHHHHQKQKKRLDYKNVGRGLETCIMRRLPDELFMKTEHPAKLPPLSKVDAGFFKKVPIDSLTSIPDCLFNQVTSSTGIKTK